MKLVQYLISTFVFFSIQISAQTPEWIQRYNGPGDQNDFSYSIAVDDSGNVFVTGQSPGIDTFDDYATIKYNSSGIVQWIARYDGPVRGNDAALAIAVDISGNVYVTGLSYGGLSDFDYDIATIKYNSSGIEQWVSRYKGSADDMDEATCIKVDVSGNVYVTGEGSELGTGLDYVTIKYNSSGAQKWIAKYNGPGFGNDYSYSHAVDKSGNVFVTGKCYISEGDNDFATIKYDSNGVLKWVRQYNGIYGNNLDEAHIVATDGSGNIYVGGSSFGGGAPNWWDYVTMKYDTDGIVKWVQRYNALGNSVDWLHSLKLSASGNIYVTGGSSGSNMNFTTIKYNPAGDMQWVKIYNGSGNGEDEAFSLSIDASENIYVTGSSKGLGTGIDYATIKYNSSGTQQWLQRYTGPANGDDYAYAIAVNAFGEVFVTGGSGTNYDFATIKYSQLVNLTQGQDIIQEEFYLDQNHPNPFNPSTKILYHLPVSNYVSLKIYDALGNEVKTLVNETQNAGQHKLEFDGSNLPSGIYFYKIEAGNFISTRKMILLK